MLNKDQKRRMEHAVAVIDKQFGKGSIMSLGDVGVQEIGVIPSGSLGLDLALGVGGYPRGRIVEVYGPESSGKTTLMLHAVAECQRGGGLAAFIDAEHALDVGYAEALGVDLDRALVSQPDCGEQALEIANTLVKEKGVDLICVDSVAALVPRSELDGEMGDATMGVQARLMSQAMRKLTAVCATNDVCIIFSNQLRQKIGVMFGNPETTTGGQALKFYASVRIDVRRIGAIKGKEGEDQKGVRTRVKVVKNKCAPPFREAEFDILYGTGVNLAGEVIDLGVEYGVVEQGGAWFSYGGERLGQGRDNAVAALRNVSARIGALVQAIRAAHRARKAGEVVAPAPAVKEEAVAP